MEFHESPIKEISIYEKLHLGLLHTILSMFIKNAQVLILLLVGLNMTVGSSDTWSDVMVFVYLIRAEFYEYAMCVGVIDMLPGIVIFLHHCNTDTWRQSSKFFRLFCLLLIPLQPFSLFIVHITWLINIGSPHWHNLAKMSTLIHGSFETPCQTILLLFLMGRGVLQIPWEENTVVTDRYNNQLPLGKIGTISLAICSLSLLKASVDSIEFDGIRQTLNGLIFSVINLCFRVPALAIAAIYLDMWVVIVFVTLFLITGTTFLYLKGSHDTTFFKATTSVAFSIFLPICASRYPFEAQLITMKDARRSNNTMNVEKDMKRKISCIVSLLTLPIIYISNILVYLMVKHLDFKTDANIVISNLQLEQIILYYISPMFVMSVLSSAIFYPSKAFTAKTNVFRKFLKYSALIGAIAIFITATVMTQKRRTTILGYMDESNILKVFQATSVGPIKNCDYNRRDYVECHDIQFTVSNVNRLLNLSESSVYISSKINESTSLQPDYLFYDLRPQ